MSDETWKSLPGAPGYEVSDLGNVRGWRKGGGWGLRAQPRPVRLQYDTRGYLAFGARIDGVTRRLPVHRCVLLAFVGPAPDGMECCHDNGVRDDNRLTNLRWDTRAANSADRRRHGTSHDGERHPLARLTWTDVSEIRRRFSSGEMQKDLAAEFGIAQTTVSKIVNGHSWKFNSAERAA